jgi:CubicO group peptidase (beta-lactamase class C family)
MQYAKQAYPLRGGFIYQNIMYLVAGQVIEKASGIPWERFVTERIFRPLGMNNTFANYTLSKNYTNRSTAHYEVKSKDPADPLRIVPIRSAPAGSVWSTSDDIGKWVNFMLGNTTVNGKELLKPATYNENTTAAGRNSARTVGFIRRPHLQNLTGRPTDLAGFNTDYTRRNAELSHRKP